MRELSHRQRMAGAGVKRGFWPQEGLWPKEGLRHGLPRYSRLLRARLGLYITPMEAELLFWEGCMRTGGYQWQEDYAHRMDPNAPLAEELIAERLPSIRSEKVRILDVGAGPTTVLGHVHDEKQLEIVAVDPLAKRYQALFRRLEITPPAPVLPCSGEDLLKRFERESFDFAFARNALDHTKDPVRIIGNMVDLVRPEGFVVLRHHRNEGVRQDYADLHRWNFELRDDDVVLWKPGHEVSLARTFADRALLEQSSDDGDGGWLSCVLKKHPKSGK